MNQPFSNEIVTDIRFDSTEKTDTDFLHITSLVVPI
jgi:hypothetical protein